MFRRKIEDFLASCFAFILILKLWCIFKKNKIPYAKIEKEYFMWLETLDYLDMGTSYYSAYNYVAHKTEVDFIKQIRDNGTLHRIEFAKRLEDL